MIRLLTLLLLACAVPFARSDDKSAPGGLPLIVVTSSVESGWKGTFTFSVLEPSGDRTALFPLRDGGPGVDTPRTPKPRPRLGTKEKEPVTESSAKHAEQALAFLDKYCREFQPLAEPFRRQNWELLEGHDLIDCVFSVSKADGRIAIESIRMPEGMKSDRAITSIILSREPMTLTPSLFVIPGERVRFHLHIHYERVPAASH